MDAGTWRGIFTVVMLLLFIGIWAWAWSGKRKQMFDAASRLPLEPDQPADPQGARSAGEKPGTGVESPQS
jgi:cytochrome c oxidase cbb3-type subunit 4